MKNNRIRHALGTNRGGELGARRGLGSIRKLPCGRYWVRFTDPQGLRRTASRKILEEVFDPYNDLKLEIVPLGGNRPKVTTLF